MVGEYAVVLKAAEDYGFIVHVSAIPEAHTDGDRIEEALANARGLIAPCLDARRERGEEMPPSDSGTCLDVVTIDLPTETVPDAT